MRGQGITFGGSNTVYFGREKFWVVQITRTYPRLDRRAYCTTASLLRRKIQHGWNLRLPDQNLCLRFEPPSLWVITRSHHGGAGYLQCFLSLLLPSKKSDDLVVFEPSVNHCLGANGLRGLAPSPLWSNSSNGGRGGKQFIIRENGDGNCGCFVSPRSVKFEIFSARPRSTFLS